ncbi:MAG: response regulator [Verrucomicrobia bacterium]|nr:response regulator [Verrucomicrobiota bacterium]
MSEIAATKPTLLIVDDEEGPRKSLRIIFKDDYDVVMADSGGAAIEIAQSRPIDVAVLDIKMEDMTGTELLDHLKAIDPAIEVVMVTAYGTTETLRQALRSGACDYLDKPYDISVMRAAVGKAMERRNLTRANEANSESLTQLQAELESGRVQGEIQRTRGEIYASVIHDINGPLTIISGFLEILTARFGKVHRIEGDELEFLRDRHSRMTKQVGNCVQISRRYLSFLRDKTAEQPPVGVNQILLDLTELLKSNPEAQKNQLILHLLAQDIVCAINGTDLMQILLNLIVNALQCTATPHRVELRIKRVDTAVNLAAHVDSPEDRFINRDAFQNKPPLLSFSISDDGPGIPPNVSVKIFDTQITTKEVGKGTGLGLSIVSRLVRNVGGAIHLQTRPGHGTTFTVYLPMNSAKPTAPGAR